MKAIAASGYFDDPVMANYKKFGFMGNVEKPYNSDELLKAVMDIVRM